MIRFVRARLTYANVIASLALFIALGGGAYAALRVPNNSIGSAQLKKNAVISSKVKNHSLRAVDFARGQLRAGPKGPRGNRGPAGLSTGPASGDLSGSYPDPSIAPGAVTPSKLGTIPAAKAYASTGQAVTNDLQAQLTFDSNVYDTAAIHSTSSDTNRMVAPIDGIYEVIGDVEWAPNATGYRELDLDTNGGTACYLGDCVVTAPNPSVDTYQRIVADVMLSAGQYVSLVAVQTSGNTLDTYGQGFSITWLGP